MRGRVGRAARRVRGAGGSSTLPPTRNTRCGWSSGARDRGDPLLKVADQRSLEIASTAWGPACRELLLTADVRRGAKLMMSIPSSPSCSTDQPRRGVEGMEALAPVLVDDMRLMLHEARRGLARDRLRSGTRAHPGGGIWCTRPRSLAASWAVLPGGQGAGRPGRASLASLDEAREDAARPRVPGGHHAARGPRSPARSNRRRSTAATPSGDDRPAYAEGWRVALVFDGARHRAAHLERSRGRGARRLEPSPTQPGVAIVTTGRLAGGLVAPSLKLAYLTEADLTGQRARSPRTRRGCRRGGATRSTRSCCSGDF